MPPPFQRYLQKSCDACTANATRYRPPDKDQWLLPLPTCCCSFCLGWLPALSLVGTCKTIIRPEVQRYLQQALCKHVPNLAPAGSFRFQIRQLFMVLVEPFLDLASSHAPRPPFALVRPEKRVHCRYYNASKWKYQGTVAEGATERLG